MRASRQQPRLIGRSAARLRSLVGVFVVATVLGSPVLGEEGRTRPEQISSTATLIGHSKFEYLPPLPSGGKGSFDAQPTNIAVPVFEIRSREEIGRGGTADTANASGVAVVYLSSADTGMANFNKDTTGNFVGNLLHLGNGFTGGDQVSGYDLLIYNDATPGNAAGGATATVSLWDGDPLGVIDTRISNPPQQILGTECTFDINVLGGDGSNGCVDNVCHGGYLDGAACDDDADCTVCPPVGAGGDVDCPGLYKLVCDFGAAKVTLPSRNVWMIVEYDGACRAGWRWAHLSAPFVAAAEEENFCGNTCPAAEGPCVDLAIEYVDAASQWSEVGVGTCCESGAACDHSDADPGNDCGHPTACSDGEAESFNAWCFGAPSYYAAFVASIYAPTETTLSVVPISSTAADYTISGNTITLEELGTESTLFQVWAANWDPNQNGTPQVKVWNASFDVASLSSGLSGELSLETTDCTTAADCPHNALNQPCGSIPGKCDSIWNNCEDPPEDNLCFVISYCSSALDYPSCGATAQFVDPEVDDGNPHHMMYLLIRGTPGAKGGFTITLTTPTWTAPGLSGTFVKDEVSAFIPLVGVVPAVVEILVGTCCNQQMECLGDDFTHAECDATGGDWEAGRTCDMGCPACESTAECDDADPCTNDECTPEGLCVNAPNFDVDDECCRSDTGAVCARDDGNSCTADSCTEPDSRGDCNHDPLPDGSDCDGGLVCTTIGTCNNTLCETGTPIECDDGIFCNGMEACNGSTGCVSTGNPCATPEDCDEVNQTCGCSPPDVHVVGPRYLMVTPYTGATPVAIQVTGDDADVACVSGYVQADGRLGPSPVYRPSIGPGGWGNVMVRGTGIISTHSYQIRLDCEEAAPGTTLSDATSATLWRAGDCDNSGFVHFVDISMVVEGFKNAYLTGVSCGGDVDCWPLGRASTCDLSNRTCKSAVQNVDLIGTNGCMPDGVIDFTDISLDVEYFGNVPDPCGEVCP